jgi:hypothetical protein
LPSAFVLGFLPSPAPTIRQDDGATRRHGANGNLYIGRINLFPGPSAQHWVGILRGTDELPVNHHQPLFNLNIRRLLSRSRSRCQPCRINPPGRMTPTHISTAEDRPTAPQLYRCFRRLTCTCTARVLPRPVFRPHSIDMKKIKINVKTAIPPPHAPLPRHSSRRPSQRVRYPHTIPLSAAVI